MPFRSVSGPSRRPIANCAVAVVATLFMAFSLMTASAQTPSAPLFAAVEQNDEAAVAKLITEGVAIDDRNADGETALLVATHDNRVDIARLLILAGADVNAKDRIHDSPYLYAGARGHLEILKLTLSHGADLKSTNRYGGTALIPAAERGHVETVRTLIEAGVAVDHVNNLGWTALLEAVLLGDGGERHVAIVKILLEAGADPSLPDREGVTPLRHARQRGFQPMVELLTKAGGRE
jgi:ankyrin repeat protein